MSAAVCRIGDLCDQIRGVTYSKDESASALSPGLKAVLRANNITEYGLSFEDLVYVPEARIGARQYVRANDVIIAASSGSIDVVGKAARVNADFDGGFGAFCKVLRPNHKVDPGYFAHFFKTPSYRRRVSALAAGANINNLRNEHIDDLEIALPAIPEQRRIAAILDKADALRAKRREAIAKLDQLLQSVFLDMFGDPATNPKGWREGSIEIVSSGNEGLRCGPFGTQLKVHELVESGVPLWGIENVHNNLFVPDGRKFLTPKKAAELKAFATRPGDVLVTRMGTIGRACVVPDDAPEGRISYHLFRVRPDPAKCLPEFLATTISRSGTFMSQLRRLARGAIMAGLNTSLLKEVKFLLPPVELQSQYLEFFRAADQIAAKHQESSASLDAQFQSLQQAAFSGRL